MAQGIARSDIEKGAIIPSKLGNELHRFFKIINVGDVAGDSDIVKHPVFKPPADITIKRVLVGVDAAITAADTDYQTVKLTDGTNIIASVSTGPQATGQSFTAGVYVELAVVAAYKVVSKTEQLKIEFTKTGSTGMAMSGLTFQIDYEINDPA